MNTLRSSLIKLAHENPELRPHLLPLLKTAAMSRKAFNMPLASLTISKTLFDIITSLDDDEIAQVPELLHKLAWLAKLVQKNIGTDPEAARSFILELSQALTRKLKIIL